MAFDGIVTYVVSKEIEKKILLGKIDKVYQPEKDELVFHVHTKEGNVKLYASVNSSHSTVNFTDESFSNPQEPGGFCMLLRKHLQGSRIVKVCQKDAERIIEIYVETLNELGFTVSKKIIFEIMGKHSNIILTDLSTGKIIDSIKHVSIDINRVRQVLPGKIYEYPPVQDKISFKEIMPEQLNSLPNDGKMILQSVGGISPAIARELATREDKYQCLKDLIDNIDEGNIIPHIYADNKGTPEEFHVADLSEYEGAAERIDFDSMSSCLAYYFNHKLSSNRVHQKAHDLLKSVNAQLNKLYLKKQRLNEDLLKAENSEDLRLYGELLTANLHLFKAGDKNVEVINYYDGKKITIPLVEKYTPSKNAQHYFKAYGKAKTAIKEKQVQLEETDEEIKYLESVLSFLEHTENAEDIDTIRTELEETGYIRKRKTKIKPKKYKPSPYKYETSDGFQILVGRNNKENDVLTLKTASKSDIWLHTKDIPGSHVIILTEGKKPTETAIFEAAAIAAYHSKARDSENVPVDYVDVKLVKKPAGAKPGMVIFTGNKTVYVNPKLPDKKMEETK